MKLDYLCSGPVRDTDRPPEHQDPETDKTLGENTGLPSAVDGNPRRPTVSGASSVRPDLANRFQWNGPGTLGLGNRREKGRGECLWGDGV